MGNDNPGAGAYNANESAVKPKSRKAYISTAARGDVVGNEAKSRVGPGQYDSPSKLGGPQYTIGEKRGHSPENGNPGAGQYDANDKAVKNRSPSAHIRGSERQDLVGRDARSNVGPGHYDSPSRMGGPKYSIAEKRGHSPANGNPGAG